MTPRVAALHERVLNASVPDVGGHGSKAPPADEWAEPFHRAWMAHPDGDPRLRFALAQAAEMAAVRPVIRPGELIIGNNALQPVVTGLPTPFCTGVRFDRGRLERLWVERPEARAELDAIEAYWTDWLAEHGRYQPMTCHAALAYERVLTLGLDGLRAEVDRCALAHASQAPDRDDFYRALRVTIDGMSAWISAHADAAEQAARMEPEPSRRDELRRIAAGCRHIAHGAPRSFAEAAQLFYLVFWLCGHDSPGPVDRYLYPALKRDLDAGVVDLAQAQEIVDCLWLKFAEKTAYGCTLAGQLPDGRDGANELSYLCLSAIERLRLLSPRTAVRWHRGLDPKFLDRAIEVAAGGASFPAFINDEALIPSLVERGVRLEHARDYTFVGCGQTYPHGRGHGSYEDLVLNAAKPLEWALHNGVDPVTGRTEGLATGSPAEWTTYESFLAAYRAQMDHYLSCHIAAVNERRERLIGRVWDGLRSLLTYSCVERGLDWHEGGADHSEGMIDLVGTTTLTDSLVAIRQAVYEVQVVTLPALVEALDRNWDGAEPLRQYLLRRVPKFGNEDPVADEMAAEEVARINRHIKSHRTVFGGPWGLDVIGWSGAMILGEQTGATPDGRRRGESLADCCGPAQGRNVRGLTATLNSTLRLPHRCAHGPLVLSLRFPPEAVADSTGRAKLRAAVETYFAGGGQDLQISIASTDDMLAAQREPERYGWLMVRVGGFSAYFTQLDRRWQDDLIARSQMGW